MDVLGMILVVLGCLTAAVGGIWLLVVAWKFGSKSELLKEWKTSLYDPQPLLTPGATIKLTQSVFFMPAATKQVRVKVTMIGFDDGTEWTP